MANEMPQNRLVWPMAAQYRIQLLRRHDLVRLSGDFRFLLQPIRGFAEVKRHAITMSLKRFIGLEVVRWVLLCSNIAAPQNFVLLRQK